jgi:hypothetical protein
LPSYDIESAVHGNVAIEGESFELSRKSAGSYPVEMKSFKPLSRAFHKAAFKPSDIL